MTGVYDDDIETYDEVRICSLYLSCFRKKEIFGDPHPHSHQHPHQHPVLITKHKVQNKIVHIATISSFQNGNTIISIGLRKKTRPITNSTFSKNVSEELFRYTSIQFQC